MEVSFGCAPLFSEGGYLTNHRGREGAPHTFLANAGTPGTISVQAGACPFILCEITIGAACSDVPGISLAGPFKIKAQLLSLHFVCLGGAQQQICVRRGADCMMDRNLAK